MSNYGIVHAHYRAFYRLSTIIEHAYLREVLRVAVRNYIRGSKNEKKISKMDEKLDMLICVNKSLANYNRDWRDTHQIVKLTAKQLIIQKPFVKKTDTYLPEVFDIINKYCEHPIALDQEIYSHTVVRHNKLLPYTPEINPHLMEYPLPIDLYKP